MSAPSTETHDMAGGREAGEGTRPAGERSARTAGNIQNDLQALRDDFSRLAEQVAGIVADKGNAAWREAKSRVDGVVADAQYKGRDAAGAMREVSDHFVGAIDQSLRDRPYATLALAAGLGFLLGATLRR